MVFGGSMFACLWTQCMMCVFLMDFRSILLVFGKVFLLLFWRRVQPNEGIGVNKVLII